IRALGKLRGQVSSPAHVWEGQLLLGGAGGAGASLLCAGLFGAVLRGILGLLRRSGALLVRRRLARGGRRGGLRKCQRQAGGGANHRGSGSVRVDPLVLPAPFIGIGNIQTTRENAARLVEEQQSTNRLLEEVPRHQAS